jgi:hypothetical protein
MSEKIEAMKIFTEFGLKRLEWDLKKIDEETLDWKISPEANSVRWLLVHISMVLNVYLPRAFTSNLNYLPGNWPKNYHGNINLSLETLFEDIKTGKNITLRGFQELSPESLEENLNWYIGDAKRETYLMILASEILHHEGQIAAIIGLKDRINGKPAEVVPPEA